MRQRLKRRIRHLRRKNTSNREIKQRQRIERGLCKLKQMQWLDEAEHQAGRTVNLPGRSKSTDVEPYVPSLNQEAKFGNQNHGKLRNERTLENIYFF